MTDLSPEAKKLLQIAREEFSPADRRVTDVRSALELRLLRSHGSGGGVGGAGPAGPAGWGVPHLIGIALVAAGFIAGAAMTLDRGSEHESQAGAARSATGVPSAREHEAASGPTSEPQSASVAPRAAPRIAFASPSVLARAQPATAAAAERPRGLPSSRSSRVASTKLTAASASTPTRTARRTQAAEVLALREHASGPSVALAAAKPAEQTESVARPDPSVTSAADSLAREVALLRRARSALDQRDPRTALKLADEHAASFANGTMRQEQLATRVLALCALERSSEAIAARHELERIAPRSPHLMGMRASCAGREPSIEVK
jgi:hypothetical protein